MPGVAQRNGCEQRQGDHWRSSTLSLLNAGGLGEKVQLALPRSAISRKGNENYFEEQPRIHHHHCQRVKRSLVRPSFT
jgi:hypothetical protein